MERRKVLAKAGVLVPFMSEKDLPYRRRSRGSDGKDRLTALFITCDGVYDAGTRSVVTAGPVSVPWTDYYREQHRLGDLIVVEEKKAIAPRGTGASKRDERVRSDS